MSSQLARKSLLYIVKREGSNPYRDRPSPAAKPAAASWPNRQQRAAVAVKPQQKCFLY